MKTSTIVRSLVTLGLGLAFLVLTGPTNAQNEPTKTHSGVIRSLNLKARTLAVDGSGTVMTFSVPTDAEIVVEDKSKNADIDKLMVGDTVEVHYTTDETNYIAHRVAILPHK